MTIEHHQSLLSSISSHNPDLVEAAKNVQEYTELFKQGQLSKEEYADLIEDIQRQINIQHNVSELESMEKLNTAINGLINIVKLI